MEEQLPSYEYEHIFTDNASRDNSVEIIRKFANEDFRIKLTINSRNVGPFKNMWNGLRKASGDVIVPMLPADLQDPPSVIPKFISLWESGFAIVYGVRINRQESLFLRTMRSIYYRMIQKFANFDIPRNAGEFMAIDKKVADSLLRLNDEYPYIRGIVARVGVPSAQVEYTWRKRYSGKSKNSTLDLIDQAVNGLISTSKIPARIALVIGFILSLAGIFAALILTIVLSMHRGEMPIGIPTIMVSISFFSGIQLLFLGLIGEYVLSMHNQIRPEPPMYEVESINFDEKRD
jgi:glycosyltransferase involved in cell wall biosynthesis